MRAEDICLTCGACCVHFRVSFYWAEADAEQGGEVPPELTVLLDSFRVAMRSAANKPVRCVALAGAVGGCVACTIYAQRPSPCREFEVSWAHGDPNPRCDQARAAWGLPPLTREEVSEAVGEPLRELPIILPQPELASGAIHLLPTEGATIDDSTNPHDDPPGNLPAAA